MFEKTNILFISQKRDEINKIIKSIKIQNDNISIASDLKEAVKLFDEKSPEILFFYHSMVEHSQDIYLKMHTQSKLISDIKHHAILFCDHSDFEIAYNKCIQDVFFDYIIMPPRLDKLRINLTIKRALLSLKQQECLNKAGRLPHISQNISGCHNDINDSISDAQTMSMACDESFNDLSNNIKDNIKNNEILAPLNKSNSSTNIDNILTTEVDKSIAASKARVKSIIDNHTSKLTTTQNKFSESITELESISPLLPKKVLIVEDNELYGEMVCTMLEQTKDYTVKHAASIEQGLVAFVCDRPDIILLDFELGDGDANNFLEKISNLPKSKDIPIIMLTSHATADVYTTTSMLGAKGFIRKPASQEIIISKINEFLN